jgi:hypothetical protein
LKTSPKGFVPPANARQVLIFIGQQLNKERLQSDLDCLLLTDDEYDVVCLHMEKAIEKETLRLHQHRAKRWSDRAWLNDLFEDYFEDFPLPTCPIFPLHREEAQTATAPSSALATKKPPKAAKSTTGGSSAIQGAAAVGRKRSRQDDSW